MRVFGGGRRQAVVGVLISTAGLLAAPAVASAQGVTASGPWRTWPASTRRATHLRARLLLRRSPAEPDRARGGGRRERLRALDPALRAARIAPLRVLRRLGRRVGAVLRSAHTFRIIAGSEIEFASEPWTLYVDPTAPNFGTAFAAYDTLWDSGQGLVSWTSANDPALTDGNNGSGVARYHVRYRRNGGAWTAITQTLLPEIGLSAALGDTVDIEVTPEDRVGNLGAVAGGQVVFTAVDLCDPNDPTPAEECVEPPDDVPVDVEEDGDPEPAARLTPEGGGDQNRATPATTYRIETEIGGCKTSRCWLTIRNKANSWAVGGVRLDYVEGTTTNVSGETEHVDSTIDVIQNSIGYSLGSLSWYSNQCAWIADQDHVLGSSTSPCTSPYRPSFGLWQSVAYGGTSSARVRGNNCFNGNGSYRKVGDDDNPAKRCTHGTAIRLDGPAVQCMNVYSIPDGQTIEHCNEKDVIRRLNQQSEWSGYCVNWRYVTKDRRWVMVRDTHRPIERGGWVYMNISAFAPNRTQWPAYDERGTCNQEGWD